MLEPNAAEAIGGVEHALETIREVMDSVITIYAEPEILNIFSAAPAFINFFSFTPPHKIIHAILGVPSHMAVSTIPTTTQAEGVETIFAFINIISTYVFIHFANVCFSRKF